MINLPEHACLFVVDLVSFVTVCGVFSVLKSSTALPVYKSEFIKNDEKYQVPFQDPFLTPGVMSIFSHVTPVIFIIALCILRTVQREGFNTGLKTVVPVQKLGPLKISSAIMAGIFYTGYFYFGACLTAILQLGIAHMVGKLSPNFLAVCEPEYTDSLVFTRDICTGNKDDVLKASLSFPSQYACHLSFGFFFNAALVYCIPQLHKVPMTRLLSMFVLIALPILGGLTKYTEGVNDLLDVVCGLVIGFSSAAFIVLDTLRLFGIFDSPGENTGRMLYSQHTPTQGQPPDISFDQLTSLPYTDLQTEMDDQ